MCLNRRRHHSSSCDQLRPVQSGYADPGDPTLPTWRVSGVGDCVGASVRRSSNRDDGRRRPGRWRIRGWCRGISPLSPPPHPSRRDRKDQQRAGVSGSSPDESSAAHRRAGSAHEHARRHLRLRCPTCSYRRSQPPLLRSVNRQRRPRRRSSSRGRPPRNGRAREHSHLRSANARAQGRSEIPVRRRQRIRRAWVWQALSA
jgi:hypothetical protein